MQFCQLNTQNAGACDVVNHTCGAGNDHVINNAILSEGISVLFNMLKGYGEYSWCLSSVKAVMCMFVYTTETLSVYAKQ